MTGVIDRIDGALLDIAPTQLLGVVATLREQRRFRIGQLRELAVAEADGSTFTVHDPRDEVTDAVMAGALNALCEIDAALARVETGRYGICEACRCSIPRERLDILPMAALCVRCQSVQDARAR